MKSYKNQQLSAIRRIRVGESNSLIFAANFLFRETMQQQTCSYYAAAQVALDLFDPVRRICESRGYGE
jgi:hypothetical protein